MDKTPKPFCREEIYKTEEAIRERVGDCYNAVINHRQKERDTFKNISPSSGLWSSKQIYKSTNNVQFLVEDVYSSVDKTYFLKMDPCKNYYEEMSKTMKLLGKTNFKSSETKGK